jgi:hypothetical protein
VIPVAVVVTIQARLPDECTLVPHGCHVHDVDFSRVGRAREVAEVVARLAPNLKTAVEAVEFAAYEGGNDPSAVGDHGASTGTWQTIDHAKTVEDQFRAWLRRREESLRLCHDLTKVASGHCGGGVRLVIRRERVRDAILQSLRDDGVRDDGAWEYELPAWEPGRDAGIE